MMTSSKGRPQRATSPPPYHPKEEEEEINAVVAAAADVTPLTQISDLPDELLENIFCRLSPYNDLENVKITCKRWYDIAQKVVLFLQTNFEEAVIKGRVTTARLSARINHLGQIVPTGSWATERFGHMACYYDKCLYIVGGTTHTPTTFNDMWRFDLGAGKWSRCLGQGQYPTPKALASAAVIKDNLVIFGGWSHPSAYPLMQPWRIFDELHIYNFTSNRWTLVIGSVKSPFPTAGHSASIVGDKMVIFGGRIFNQAEQSYPLSNSVWMFDFDSQEWSELGIIGMSQTPSARYGPTQVTLDDTHILIVGGCGGPNQIFSDVWLLTLIFGTGRNGLKGKWDKVEIANPEMFTANDFHYHGCKVGNSVVFLERTSPMSPFLAFLQYDVQHYPPGGGDQQQRGANFDPVGQRYFHSRRPSGARGSNSQATMSIYSLDISNVITSQTAAWTKESASNSLLTRPDERLLYSMVQGRAELVLFGGFYKDITSPRCRVSSDVFVINQLHKSY